MSTLNATPPPSRAKSRLILQSVVVMLAVTACCMFAGLIADRYPKHLDVTSTREHRLSPRTLDILTRLDGDYELVVTMNSAAAEPRAARRTQDVLDAFQRVTPRLKATVIDIGAENGLAQLDGVLNRVLERSKQDVAAEQAALEGAVNAFPEIAASMDRLSTLLNGADQTVTENGPNADALRKFLADSPAIFRLQAQDLAKAAEQIRAAIRQPIGRSPVPALDSAGASMQPPLNKLLNQLSDFEQSAESAIKASSELVPEATKQRLRPAVAEIPKIKDRVARLLTTVEQQPRLSIITVARVLERASAAIVIGPPRAGEPGKPPPRTVTAVDIETLFPPVAPGARDESTLSIDLRARTEDLLSSSLASLTDTNAPIVVLTHSEPVRFAPNFDRFYELAARMRLRGIDLVEWPVSLDELPPDLAKVNPGGKRPVVYAILYTPGPSVEAAARLAKFSRVVEALYNAGKPMLFSVTPSTLPAVGQPDLMTDFFSSCGVKIDAGRPLMRQVGSPASPAVSTDMLTSASAGTHPIDGAIRGLRVRLPWVLPLKVETPAKPGSEVTPLLIAASDGRTWAESQWTDYAAVQPSKRTMIRPQDLPKPDSSRDDAKGPWVVAAAVERTTDKSTEKQRVVIVGSNTWFRDDVAEAAELVENRVRLINPGNSELFESSVFWLAGKDASIGASPEARSVSVIPNDLSPGLLSAIRWMLIAGLPLVILLTGAVWRVVRG